jgi:hypothetical protein
MTAVQGNFWRGDFTAYYTGWSLLRDGHTDRLYDIELQTQYQQEILEGQRFKGGVLPYINPPHAAIPFLPLAWLPRSTAFWIWSLGQCGLLVWLLVLLRRITRAWDAHERHLMMSAVVAFPPLFTTFLLGTFSLFMCVCVVQYYVSLKERRETRGGLWLALGSVKPQLMLMPGFVVLGARRWKALGSGIAILLVFIAISLIFPGWQSWQGFFRIIGTIAAAFDSLGNVPADMYNLKGTLTLLAGNVQHTFINLISTGALLGVIVATLLLWRGSWNPESAVFDLRLSFTLLLGLIFSPHLHQHDALVLVVPAVLFYAYLRQRGVPRRAYAAFLLLCPLLFLVAEFTVNGALGIRIPVLAMGVLAVLMGRALLTSDE